MISLHPHCLFYPSSLTGDLGRKFFVPTLFTLCRPYYRSPSGTLRYLSPSSTSGPSLPLLKTLASVTPPPSPARGLGPLLLLEKTLPKPIHLSRFRISKKGESQVKKDKSSFTHIDVSSLPNFTSETLSPFSSLPSYFFPVRHHSRPQ